jgi:hypothetical protein
VAIAPGFHKHKIGNKAMSLMMNSSDLELGQSRTGSDTVGTGQLQTNLGMTVLFENRNWAASGVKTIIDSRHFVGRLVRNASGGTILPRLQVSYGTVTDEHGLSFAALTGNNSNGAGFVDPFLPAAGIVDDGICWIITEGPCDVENTADGTIAVGDRIVSAAAGQVNEQTAPASQGSDQIVAEQALSFVGVAEEAATNVAGTVFRCDLTPKAGN